MYTIDLYSELSPIAYHIRVGQQPFAKLLDCESRVKSGPYREPCEFQ